MTFSSSERAAIRRAFDAIVGDVVPARDLEALVTHRRGSASVVVHGPRSWPVLAAAFAVVVVIGAATLLLTRSHEASGPDDSGMPLDPGSTTPVLVSTTTAVPTTTMTGAAGEQQRRATAALMACMVGTWEFDGEAFAQELQRQLDPEGDDLAVSVDSGGGTLVVGPTMTFVLSYRDLTVRLESLTSDGTTTVVTVTGEVGSTFRLDRSVFLPGPIDEAMLTFLHARAADPVAGLLPPFSYRALQMGTADRGAAKPENITIECSGGRLVVLEHVLTASGEAPSVTWLRRPG
jgi:hypothetical protein